MKKCFEHKIPSSIISTAGVTCLNLDRRNPTKTCCATSSNSDLSQYKENTVQANNSNKFVSLRHKGFLKNEIFNQWGYGTNL